MVTMALAASATAVASVRANAASSPMKASEGSTASTACSPARRATAAAPSPTAAAVLRAAGSATTLASGNSGSSARTASAWSAAVTTSVRGRPKVEAARRNEARSSDSPPPRDRSCLGRLRRLAGQRRVPPPPARMRAYASRADMAGRRL